MTRLILFLFALLGLSPAFAAEPPGLSERSLLKPGVWWNPQTSGNGLDLHLGGRSLGLGWYTYREDGTPIWYHAAGEFNAEGVVEADLLELHWTEAGVTQQVVGSIRLSRINSEHARFEYQLGDETGVWNIEPVQYTAQRVEVDPSGAYYLPQSSGFGLSIEQIGTVQAAAYYAFDQQGRPEWFLGVRENAQGPISFEKYRRSCPRCPTVSASVEATFAASLDTVPGQAALAFDVVPPSLRPLFAQPAPLSLLTIPVSARSADYRPARFENPETLERFIERSMLDPDVWRWAYNDVDFSPAPPPPATPVVSTTNLIESGVDEADRVKSDGEYAYFYDPAQQRIRIARRDGETPHFVAVSAIDPMLDEDERFVDGTLYLDGDRLVFLATTQRSYGGGSIDICPSPPQWWQQEKTAVRIFDRSNPAAPIELWRADIDGELITSRTINGHLYLIQRFTPYVEGFAYGGSSEAALQQNTQLLGALGVEDFLPQLTQGEHSEPWLLPGDVYLPPSAERREQPDFTVVSRINIADPSDRESMSLVNGVSAIYVSPSAIYLSTTRQDQNALNSGLIPTWFTSTDVHKISLTPEGLMPGASGAVDGWITPDRLQQPFRISEHDRVLRVLTIDNLGASGVNLLTQLRESTVMPGLLTTVSVLPNRDRPAPIGKPFERLYGSRFVGDRLYASTFRTVDPFYVVDLHYLADPKIAGEIEMPGFSNYLHPVDENLMLGIGHEADPGNGLLMGIKLALFDVSDPNAPRLVDDAVIGQRGSQTALTMSHHALSVLRLEDGRLRVALPVRVHGLLDPAGSPDPTYKPFTLAGLQAFDVMSEAGGGHLENRGVLVTGRPGNDLDRGDSADGARSLLFQSGAAYFSRGQIWSARWDTIDAPIGPY